MSAERGPQNVHPPRIDVLIKDNFDWVMGGKGQFKGNGHSFEQLIGSSLDYLISRYRPEDRKTMRASCQARLAKMKSADEKFRLIADDIVADWHKNAP